MTEHNNPAPLAEANGRNARFGADHFAEIEKANRDALGAHHKPGRTVAELITALVGELAEAREFGNDAMNSIHAKTQEIAKWVEGYGKLSADNKRLTRERDEAQQSLEAAHRELADYQQQYADLWRDANTERIQFDRVLTHLVPAARQVNGTVSGLVLREQAGDLVKKLITDLETRLAISADAADLAWSACMDDDKFTGLASDQILEVIRRTLKAVTPAPASGSDTTEDGEDRG